MLNGNTGTLALDEVGTGATMTYTALGGLGPEVVPAHSARDRRVPAVSGSSASLNTARSSSRPDAGNTVYHTRSA